MEPERSNPYVGPRPFHRSETIYGRKREAKELISLLIAERVVLFFSPSGAGKTSLIQTTLIPMLEQEDFTVFPVMRVSSGLAWSFPAEATRTQPATPCHGEVTAAQPVRSSSTLNRPRSRAGRTRSARSERSLNRYILSLLVALETSIPAGQQLTLDELKCLTLSEYLDQRFRKNADTDGHDEIVRNGDQDDYEDEYEDEPEYQVLIFDQLEEVLRIDPTNEAARKDFFEQVGEALGAPHRWAILVVREDYIASLRPYFRVIPTRMNNTYRLDLLVEARARKAIQEPALQHGVTFDEAALDQLINALRLMQVYDQLDGSMQEVQSHAVDPLLLQVVCYRLWQQLPTDQQHIGVEMIMSIGRAKQALGDYYNDCMHAVVRECGMDEPTLRSWIEETFITQHSMRRKVLQEPDQSQGMDNRVLMYLVAANLVRIEVEQQGETTWFELAHERMITPIRQSNAAWHETRLNRQRQQEKQAMLHRQALQRRWIAGLGIATALLALVAILFFLRSQHEYTRAEESTEQVTILQTTNEALLPMITAQAALTRTNIALQQTQVILEANPPVPPPSPDLSESVPLSTRPPRPAADATVQHAVSPLDVSIPSPSLPAAPTRTPTTTPLTTTLTLIATPTLTSTLERASEQAPGPR